MTKLELQIAWRYLRSRRGSKLLSLISIIAIGGVMVGVSALIVIIGVMNGLQHDLREKILVGSPDVRVLSYGEGLRINDWQETLEKVRKQPGVVAAAPFVLTEALMTTGHDYAGGVYVVGILPAGRGVPDVTTIRSHATDGDFRFASSDGQRRGVVLGKLLASRFNKWPGDTINLHAFWDGVVTRANRGGSPLELARRLAAATPVDVKSTEISVDDLSLDATLGDWAAESATLARYVVYDIEPRAEGAAPPRTTPAYERLAEQIARQRVTLAGYRLAALLETRLR